MEARIFRPNHGRTMRRDSGTQAMNTGLVFWFIGTFLEITRKRKNTVCSPHHMKLKTLQNIKEYHFRIDNFIEFQHFAGTWIKYVYFLYWGNDAIHDLTKSGKAKLRIDLKKFNGEQGNVTYSTFKVNKFSVGPTYMVVFAASFFTLSYTFLLYTVNTFNESFLNYALL